jgi:hypothetical protein
LIEDVNRNAAGTKHLDNLGDREEFGEHRAELARPT